MSFPRYERYKDSGVEWLGEQFANSPDLANGILNAVMDAFAAHSTMSKQALDSEKVRGGLKDLLLGPANCMKLCEPRATPIWVGFQPRTNLVTRLVIGFLDLSLGSK
jgi:hypothetical protein